MHQKQKKHYFKPLLILSGLPWALAWTARVIWPLSAFRSCLADRPLTLVWLKHEFPLFKRPCLLQTAINTSKLHDLMKDKLGA